MPRQQHSGVSNAGCVCGPRLRSGYGGKEEKICDKVLLITRMLRWTSSLSSDDDWL
jgi:hypothetical protein